MIKGGDAEHEGCEITVHRTRLDLGQFHCPTSPGSLELEMISNTMGKVTAID